MLKRVITDKDIINALVYDSDSGKKVKGTNLILSKIHPSVNPKVILSGSFKNGEPTMDSYPSHITFADLTIYPEDDKTFLHAISFDDENGDPEKGLTFLFSERKACCCFAILQGSLDLHTEFLDEGVDDFGQNAVALYKRVKKFPYLIRVNDSDDSLDKVK